VIKFKQEKGKCSICQKASLNAIEADGKSCGVCDKHLISFLQEVLDNRVDLFYELNIEDRDELFLNKVEEEE